MNGLDIVIFELAGKPVLLIDLVSSVLGLTCVFLAGRNSKYNFWVGYLYTTALFLPCCCSRYPWLSTCWDIGAGPIRGKTSRAPATLRL